MFLHLKGKPLPEVLKMEGFTADPEDGTEYRPKPQNLVPLGESGWPEEVKADIVSIFKRVGLISPLSQKLVEPYAIVFGGREKDGEAILDNVNWELAVDYFEWEAASLTDPDRANALQQKAEKKYGFPFAHHRVYWPED